MYVTYLLDRSEMRSFTKNVQIKKKKISKIQDLEFNQIMKNYVIIY